MTVTPVRWQPMQENTTHPSKIYLESSPRRPRSPTLAAPHRWPPESEQHRSRAPEFYGFVAWTSTYLLFVLYILWAILPDRYIVWFGITWYPNRYVLLLCFWTFFFFLFLNFKQTISTQGMGHFNSFMDDYSHFIDLFRLFFHCYSCYTIF